MKKNKVLPMPLKIVDNMARHASMAISFPLGYAWLPISCCFVMPTVKYAMGEDFKEAEAQEPIDKFAHNFTGMVAGCATIATIGCCFGGCCGAQSPSECYLRN